MTMPFMRNALLASTMLTLGVVAGSPAFAQDSGAPASGTTISPPATGATTDSSPAQAGAAQQAQAAQAQSGGLQDIIVTARRTNEKLQSTPVAVTALTAQTLVTKQIAQVTDLQRATPSLSIGTGGTGPASIVYLAIRGEAQNSPNSFSDNAVGIYVDGVYVGRPLVGNLGFLDISDAEVLRGPQGTLFGRNTTAGALNITTAQPTDRFEGYVKAGVGNYNSRVIEGVINIPMSESLSARFAGRYDAHDGYYPDAYTGQRMGKIKGEYYGRGTVKWAPSSLPITLTVSGDYTHYRDNGNATAVAAINPNSTLAALYNISQQVQNGQLPPGTPLPAFGPGITAGDFTNFAFSSSAPLSDFINSKFPGATGSKNWKRTYSDARTGDSEIDNLFNFNSAGSATANLVVDLGSVTVKSITGYRLSDTADSLDLTGTPTGGGAFISEYKQHQFSEELQLSGKLGRLDYITGLYYFREAGNERSDSEIFYNSPFGTYNRNFGQFVSSSKGAFAQVNYHVTDALRITGGFRYTWDSRFINRHPLVDFRDADPVCNIDGAKEKLSVQPCSAKNRAKFSYPAWLASVDYKLSPDIFLYAKTSGASLSGGFNSRPVPFPYSQSFKPENVRDVEAGFKGEFLNHHVRTNLAAFYAWQSSVQRIINTTFVDSAGATELTQFVSNAGKVHVYGLEFEGTVIPWKGMTIDGSAAYLHARYVKGSRSENQLVPNLDDAGDPILDEDGNPTNKIVSVDRSGEPITQAPKWTASIGATQVFDVGENNKLSIHGDYSYIASRYFDYFTTGDPAQAPAVAIANQASKVKGYGLINGIVTYTLTDAGLEFSLWGKNLTDKAYFTNVFNSYTGLGATTQFQGTPRTYGVTIAYRWK